jgi:hypothetical protein
MKALFFVGLVVLVGCSGEDRRLASIHVSLANNALYAPGQTQASAVGTYTDGVEEDLTASVTWSSSSISIGDVDVHGAVFALAPGRTDIRAALDDVAGAAVFTVLEPQLESIAITGPSQLLPNGLFLQLAATGHYNNGTTRTITSAVTWSTGSTTIATIDSTGKLAAHSVGGTTVHAAQGAITADLPISVTDAVLVTLAITPNPVPQLPKGLTVDLEAHGTFSDATEHEVTDLVTWATTQDTVATVETATNKGRVTAVATSGATNIIATYNASNGTFSDTVTVSAAPAVIVRVEIDPPSLSLPLGRSDDLSCTAVYSDTTETDVTDDADWDSAAAAVVAVDNTTNKGHVTANLATTGTTQVSCDYLTFSDEIDVVAADAVLDHVDVTPNHADVLIHGDHVQFTAVPVLSNGQTASVPCLWNADGQAEIHGGLLLSTMQPGAGTVHAICGTIPSTPVAGMATYTAYATTTLELVADDTHGATVAIGGILEHHALAHTSGPDFDVTALATYDTPTTTTLQVGTPGDFTAIAAGPGTARATFDGKIATRNVTVTP